AGRDGGTAYDVFHNSEPNRWIKAPATIDHRFLNEDVPYGLVAIAELGRAAGVPTPCADAAIDIASIVAARPFRRYGLTRDRLGPRPWPSPSFFSSLPACGRPLRGEAPMSTAMTAEPGISPV